VKDEHDELSQANGQFQSELGSIRYKHDEVRQECIIA
jgi:hypothetical protein